MRGNFAQKVEFYQHEQNWSNCMILGDSLLVMTSLAEKEGLKGKVQTIYLDPSYGIKFGSNWQVSTRKRHPTHGIGTRECSLISKKLRVIFNTVSKMKTLLIRERRWELHITAAPAGKPLLV